jgi:cytochrome c oxidase cbb3-type subunit I/II
MFYWLAPRLWSRKLYSTSLANMHFWLGLVGILLYVASMWVSGVTQGLMLSATRESGTVLAYPNFLDAVTSTKSLMHIRAFGGTLYLAGFVMLAWNIFKTAYGAEPLNGTMEVHVKAATAVKPMGLGGGFVNAPVIYSMLYILFAILWGATSGLISGLSLAGLAGTTLALFIHRDMTHTSWSQWYEQLLENSLPFTALTALAVVIGGIVQIVPTVIVNKADGIEGVRQIPYTPLELAGRDIYVREGCYNCHSQMIRTLVGDVLRYGDYSKLGESIYDYPFQWGSKRIGPDLAREGGKYPSVWHYHHMRNPRQISPGSTMPNYPWLFAQKTEVDLLPHKIEVQRRLGVPFPEQTPAELARTIASQEQAIASELNASGAEIQPDREIVALISYLQKLGKCEKVNPIPAAAPAVTAR